MLRLVLNRLSDVHISASPLSVLKTLLQMFYGLFRCNLANLGNGLIAFSKLMGNKNFYYFSVIIADVFPPWFCVYTHLKAPAQRTVRASAFLEVVTLAKGQLIKSI